MIQAFETVGFYEKRGACSPWVEGGVVREGERLFVLKAQPPRAGGMSKDILPFPLSAFLTAAEISLSLEVGRAQLGQAEEPEATLDEYIPEAGFEACTFLVIYAAVVAYRSAWTVQDEHGILSAPL